MLFARMQISETSERAVCTLLKTQNQSLVVYVNWTSSLRIHAQSRFRTDRYTNMQNAVGQKCDERLAHILSHAINRTATHTLGVRVPLNSQVQPLGIRGWLWESRIAPACFKRTRQVSKISVPRENRLR